MRKVYILEDLDCAHCATKIEEGIGKLQGVITCNISFMTKKMVLEVEEDKIEKILVDAKKIIKKLEPDITVIEKV
ncbi:MAG TPA: heavy-metal-associated domain-containing protein [Lachnospiraceae bacterium]|nr:heavy-metal-associated domain-containing protein [Lachnospiraceae bacterium]